jgi:hypothetical protein
MAKFQIGDLVRVKYNLEDDYQQPGTGLVGKIIENKWAISVEFPVDIGGHDCQGHGQDRHCWNYSPRDLILVEKFKIKPYKIVEFCNYVQNRTKS